VPPLELRFDFLRALGRVGPNLSSSLGRQQHVREVLTVMDCGLRDRMPPNQFGRLIHVDMVFVAIVIFAMLHRPARGFVFLPALSRVPLPFRRAPTRFECGVFVARVALRWHGGPTRHQSVGPHEVVSRARPSRLQIAQRGSPQPEPEPRFRETARWFGQPGYVDPDPAAKSAWTTSGHGSDIPFDHRINSRGLGGPGF